MDQRKLVIKNMVCDRCISAVERIFEESEITLLSIKLGEAVPEKNLTDAEQQKLSTALASAGFELLQSRETKIVSRIKSLIVEKVHHSQGETDFHLGKLLTSEIPHSYGFMSQLFSEVEGITLEKFLIEQRIERVKELLFYDEKSLSEIAWEMGYSSVQHLSAQFKKVTGMTPSAFKKNRPGSRKNLDKI
ncbi:AraC family transcriptional regulator [Halocola ammonii]